MRIEVASELTKPKKYIILSKISKMFSRKLANGEKNKQIN